MRREGRSITHFVSKHAKYNTRNPVNRYLVRNFLKTIKNLVASLGPSSLLDVGCGEGMLLKSMEEHVREIRCAAIDLDPAEVGDAALILPWCQVDVGSAYEIPYEADHFELVICCEVLEHLEHPEKALRELSRVSSKYVLLSVPREPTWRALNMLRGAYLKDWGNTPGHIQHWSPRSFEAFTSSQLRIVRRAHPLPWTVVLGVVDEVLAE
jgi:2-polyprenyl-3-methyl-5-hydroxy-6-metoxy-1,4-benzoquinol methylase